MRVAASQQHHATILNDHDLVLLAVRLVATRHLKLQSAVACPVLAVLLLQGHEHGCLARNFVERVLLTQRHVALLNWIVEFLEAEVLMRLAFQLFVLNRLLKYFVLSQLLLVSFLDLSLFFLEHLRSAIKLLVFHFQIRGSLVHLVLLVLYFRILVAHFAFMNS